MGSPSALTKVGLKVSLWRKRPHRSLKDMDELTKKGECEGSPRRKSMALGVKESIVELYILIASQSFG